MDESNAATLFDRLGCQRVRFLGEEATCSCPFPENHRRGDRRSSFSAHIDPNDKSPYLCHGCHARGTLEGLSYERGYEDLVPEWKPKHVRTKDWIHIPSTNAGIFSDVCKKKRPVLFRDDYLKPFIGRLSGYLKKRGITLETAKMWELGVDTDYRRATFTVRDYKGNLALVIGRDVSGRSKVKYSNYVLDTLNGRMVPFIDHDREEDFRSPTKSFFLYGEHVAWRVSKGEIEIPRCKADPHLIVVEGVTDVLKLWQMGWNSVAVLGSYPSDMQVEKISTLLPNGGKVILMADGDAAGRKLTDHLGKKLMDRLPVFDAVLPDGMDPGEADDSLIDETFASARMFSLTSY